MALFHCSAVELNIVCRRKEKHKTMLHQAIHAVGSCGPIARSYEDLLTVMQRHQGMQKMHSNNVLLCKEYLPKSIITFVHCL